MTCNIWFSMLSPGSSFLPSSLVSTSTSHLNYLIVIIQKQNVNRTTTNFSANVNVNAAVTCLPNQNLICWPSQTASYQRLEQFNQNIIDKQHGSGTFDCMHVSIHFEHKLKLTKICGCLAVSLTKICILSIMETCIPRTSFFWNFNSHELNGAVHSVEIYNVYTA